MKIQTTKYMLKEGFLNTSRNKLMSVISTGMVVVAMIVFGIYICVMLNLNHITSQLKQDYEIFVFCPKELQNDDLAVLELEESIKNNPEISEYRKVTKEEGYEKFKNDMLEDPSLLEGLPEDFLPVKFSLKLVDLNRSEIVIQEIKELPNVEDVKYAQGEMDIIYGFSNGLHIASIIIALILAIAAIFIISNTIRLTVFSRRKEIYIMKHIGATDNFIRIPFLIEGAMIGIIGSLISFIIVAYSYAAVINPLNENIKNAGAVNFNLLILNRVWLIVFAIQVILGLLVGIAGSTISIRKHLKV